MQGLMKDTALTITSLMQFADRNRPEVEIASVTGDNPLHRYTYGEAFARTRKLANALAGLDLTPGDRVATLAWNDHRHLELYYATSCSGYVCHTINPRLFAEQIAYIITHAEDQLVFTDPMFVPMLEELQPRLGCVRAYVILTDAQHMPTTSLPNSLCYETLIADEPDTFDWPELQESAASALCYTSGTTGNPKGVLYNHRSTILHAYASVSPNVMNLSSRDVVMAVVPMFHVNAWGMPYSVPMAGAKFVMPGPKMGDAAALCQLIQSEGVTFSAAVPTVWMGMLAYLEETGGNTGSLQRIVTGGAACPVSIMDRFREDHGVTVHHAWGMTEMSPLGTFNSETAEVARLPDEQRSAQRAKQGPAVFGVELRITGPDGADLPWDGEAFGALKVRGPWVSNGYFRIDQSDSHDADGWFDTGDVATIDQYGYMQITDRTKDVIKSGGEWVSSIELENVIAAHPAVAEAAVIAVPHPKWTERPLLIVVRKPGAEVSEKELLEYFDGKVAKWWIPDSVEFTDELPHTATGKVSKLTLRQKFTQG